MDEEFEQWETWFDSHKESGRSVYLSKNPDLCAWLDEFPMTKEFPQDFPNLGETVNYDYHTIEHG